MTAPQTADQQGRSDAAEQTADREQLAQRLRDPWRLREVASVPHEGAWRERAQTIAALAAQMLSTEIAEVNLVTDTHMHCLASAMTDAYSRDVGDSYCQHVVATGATVAVYDSASDDRVRDSASASRIRCYLGIPLTHRGHVLGALCVAGPEPRTWTDVEIEMLTELTQTLLTSEGWVA